jgi:diguanylate cyclase (GGDEF)-like protein
VARKRIGFQTSRLEYGYGVKLWQGAMAGAERADADLFIFPGRNLDAPYGFDYQYNRIFSLMSSENLDAIVLVATLVSNYIDRDALLEFCARFKDIPVVSIGIEVPGVPSVLIDNRSGVRDLVRHLAEGHAAERIAFIKGPESNWEAAERLAAYREELERLGLERDARLEGDGDFTPHSVRPALDRILASCPERPDAFIFANDEMAIKGMHILRERGIEAPEDAAVAGFDDIFEASMLETPLTTVRQPLYEMGRAAIGMAMDLMDGKAVPGATVLPTEPVLRSSCGCSYRCVEELQTLERLAREAPSPGTEGEAALSLAMSVLGDRGTGAEGPGGARSRRIREALGILRGEGGTAGGFVRWFGKALQEERRADLDPSDWQYILPVLADIAERGRAGAEAAGDIVEMARSCTALAAEAALIRAKSLSHSLNEANLALHEAQYGLSSTLHMEDLVEKLKDQLPRLGIPSFIVSRYEGEWLHAPRTPWEMPERQVLVGGVLDGEEIGTLEGGAYPSGLLFPPGVTEGRERRSFVVYPLFFRETHFGTIAYEVRHVNGIVFESLTTQISGVMKTISLFRGKEEAEDRLRQALAELESYNRQLSYLSLTDELTGLYNRRGFIRFASQALNLVRQMGKKAMLVFGDIDGLKEINDTYGHEAGDEAIKTFAAIIKRTFRAMDIIARLGGDEFTVFAPYTEEEHAQLFMSRISDYTKEANAREGIRFPLSISVGWVLCRADGSRTLGDYMRDADKALYEKKKSKKKGGSGSPASPL